MRRHRRKIKRNRRGETANFLGQHLMHNKQIIHEMVKRAKISKEDVVLDLGAGKGALTVPLSKKAGKVLAVEYDRKFVQILNEKLSHSPNVKVIHGDILKLRMPKQPFIVVSNIPYSITTPIMKMLMNNPCGHFQRGVLVIEKGAAKRFTGNFVKDPCVIAWRMWFDIHYVREISRKNFSPPPKVDSAMIVITRKGEPLVPYCQYLFFGGLASYVMKYPHAPLDLALKGVFTPPQITHLKRNLKIKSDLPVGALSERQWGIIFDTMVNYVPKFRWPRLKKETWI